MSINSEVAGIWVTYLRIPDREASATDRRKAADLLEELASEVIALEKAAPFPSEERRHLMDQLKAQNEVLLDAQDKVHRPPAGLYRMNYFTDGTGMINRIDGENLTKLDRDQLNDLLNTKGMLWGSGRPNMPGIGSGVLNCAADFEDTEPLPSAQHDEHATKVLRYANEYLLKVGLGRRHDWKPAEGSTEWLVNELYTRILRQARQMINIEATKVNLEAEVKALKKKYVDPDPDGPVIWPTDIGDTEQEILGEENEVIDRFATKNARAGGIDPDDLEEELPADLAHARAIQIPTDDDLLLGDTLHTPDGVDLNKDPEFFYEMTEHGTKAVKMTIRRSDGERFDEASRLSLYNRFKLTLHRITR